MSNNPPKFKVLVEAPVFSRSGYGEWADALVPMLIKYPHFNTKVAISPWGNCVSRQTPLPEDNLINANLYPLHQLQRGQIPNADIYISINLPMNATPIGRIFNMNITAGLEVDRCPDYMMEAANRWDLSILMSKFSKQVYDNSNIKPAKPCEILGWGQDTSVFKPDRTPNASIESMMAVVKEHEAFLYTGQRTHHLPECDRKNGNTLIEAFCKAFDGKTDKPALILKTSGTTFSNYDRNENLEIIKHIKAKSDVSLYLLHGELSNHEFNALYNHPRIIAGVSATRGEGWGGSLCQMTLCGKPVIASNYGGHLDYLDSRAILVDGALKEIPKPAVSDYFMEGSKWFDIDKDKLSVALSDFYYNDRTKHLANAVSLMQDNRRRFSLQQMQKQLYQILDKHILA